MSNNLIRRKLFVLHCIYNLDDADTTLNELSKLSQKLKNNFQIQIICINNNFRLDIDYLSVKYKNQVQFINGSNSFFEFSAWKEGYLAIEASVENNTLILFSNDTFYKNHPFKNCLDIVFLKFLLSSNLNFEKYICGIVQKINYEIVDNYITTCFFIIDGRASKVLLDNITDMIIDVKLNERPNKITENLVLGNDIEYVNFIQKWLTVKTKRSWYNAQKINKSNRSLLLSKAMCIILEHSLSVNAQNKDILVLDIFRATNMRIMRKFYSFRKEFKNG
ncbi:MAG: hypothetical protein RLY43_1060 [Bacteroidota bacterium]|jgi:hypothetical protein